MLGVVEIKVLKFMSGVTRKDRIENEYIRDGLGVSCIEQKMRESRLRWYGHVNRKGEDDVVSRVRKQKVNGCRSRGRPKKTWDATVEKDMKTCGLTQDMVFDRDEWRTLIKMPTLECLDQNA